MHSRNDGEHPEKARIRDGPEVAPIEKTGCKQEDLRSACRGGEQQETGLRAKCPQKGRYRNCKNDKIKNIERLNAIAKKIEAQPRIIDKAEIVAPASANGLVGIEWPFEMDGLVDGGINEFRAVQIVRKFHFQIGKDFRVAGQAPEVSTVSITLAIV